MSRIGKNPISIPSGVEVTVDNSKVTVKGPKGELSMITRGEVSVAVADNEVQVTVVDPAHANFHGLTRTLIANMVEGVSKGFEKKLEIQGVGYKAQVQGTKVVLNLGYSHPINYTPYEGVTVQMDKEKKNIIIVSGIDKQKVGQVASEIRGFRPPEPYKGKGIRYEGEYVARKAGKSAAK